MKKTVYILLLLSAATILVLYLRGCPGGKHVPYAAVSATEEPEPLAPSSTAPAERAKISVTNLLAHANSRHHPRTSSVTRAAGVATPLLKSGDDANLTGTNVNDNFMLQFRERYPSAAAMEVVQLDPILADLARRYLAGEHIAGIHLPMPHGKTVDILITDHQTIEFERGVFLGQVTGYPYSEVILSYYNEAMNGSIIIPGVSHYEIAYLGQGQHLIMEIDPDKILPSAPPIIPPLIDDPD